MFAVLPPHERGRAFQRDGVVPGLVPKERPAAGMGSVPCSWCLSGVSRGRCGTESSTAGLSPALLAASSSHGSAPGGEGRGAKPWRGGKRWGDAHPSRLQRPLRLGLGSPARAACGGLLRAGGIRRAGASGGWRELPPWGSRLMGKRWKSGMALLSLVPLSCTRGSRGLKYPAVSESGCWVIPENNVGNLEQKPAGLNTETEARGLGRCKPSSSSCTVFPTS